MDNRAIQFQTGLMITFPLPAIAEMVSKAGFDWVMIDMEHSPISILDAQHLVMACGGDCMSIIRVPAKDSTTIGSVLDLGCDGIMVPMVNSAEEAQQIVKMAKYAPEGTRGIGIGKAHSFGLNFQEYLIQANQNIKIILQIEHVDAVSNLDAILKVKGYEALLVGPNDLASSMGHLGNVHHPDVIETIKGVQEKCKVANVQFGIFGSQKAFLDHFIWDWCQYVVQGADAAIFSQALKRKREELA